VLDYDVTIRNNTISYDSASIRKRAASTTEHYCYNETSYATLGFVGLMQPYVTANGSLGQWNGLPRGKHPLETYWAESFTSFSMEYLESISDDSCTMNTHDPMDDIIAAFDNLLFRSAIYLGSHVDVTDLADTPYPVHQLVQADRTQDLNVFHTDYGWFFAAAAVQTLTILLILPAYWGE
jgi:hypothetical protein